MSVEIRGCVACDGTGSVLLDSHYEHATGRLTQEWGPCPTCHGQGTVPLFLYAAPRKRDMRALDDDRLLWLAWCGSAREKHLAEAELRRRQDRP